MADAPRQVLLVKTSSLGDVIHAMPAVSEAAQHNVEFTWVVEEAFAEVAELHPQVDRVIPVALRRWRKGGAGVLGEVQAFYRQLREQRFDLVLDSQGLIKSAILSFCARGTKVGFSHTTAREPWSAFLYEKRYDVAKGQHAVLRQRQLFARALGYELDTELPVGLSLDAERNNQVVLLHGTTWESKHCPEVLWVGLARLINAAGYEAVFTFGNSDEETRARHLAAQAPVTVLPKQGLTQLANVLAGATAVVGVDTGLTHLAATMGTPTVGLYGPTSPALTGCLGVNCVSLDSNLDCAPCLSATCQAYTGDTLRWVDPHDDVSHEITPACFAGHTPDTVWAQVQTLMSQVT